VGIPDFFSVVSGPQPHRYWELAFLDHVETFKHGEARMTATIDGTGDSNPSDIVGERGFGRVFRPGHLTFGFITPIEGYPDSAGPTMTRHSEMARRADEADVAAIWLRDVPFYDPSFGDVGQVLDPLVYAGWLAANTRNIAIGTAGLVLPLRQPLHVAKAAASIDQLSNGRFMLGLAGGDRPGEFPTFGIPYDERSARYRDGLDIIKAAGGESFTTHVSEFSGFLDGTLDLIPKPVGSRLPTVAIGRSGQDLPWIASNMDAWIASGFDIRRIADVVPQWREFGAGAFKGYGYGMWFDLDDDPDAPVQFGRVFIRGGRKPLTDFFHSQQEAGVNHVVLNIKPTRRDPAAIIDELAEHVFPAFPRNETP
jgi:luciferase-type oxidoreductase